MTLGDWARLAFVVGGLLIGVVTGPALSWLVQPVGPGSTLEEIRDAARSGSRRPQGPRDPRPSSGGSDDELWAWLACAFVIVGLYVHWRAWVLLAVSATALAIGLVACFVAIMAWSRRVMAGAHAAIACLLLPFAYSSVGIATSVLLWRAPHAPSGVGKMLAACSINVGGFTGEGFTYLAYSIMGGALFVILALGTIWWDLATIAAIYAAKGVRPARLWLSLAGHLDLPLGWGWPAWGVLVSAMSLTCASGYLYLWLSVLAR